MDHAAVVTAVVADPPSVVAVAPAAGSATGAMTAIPVAPPTAPAEAAPAEAGLAEAGLAEAGLAVVAEARWPESEFDQAPPPLPGFIVSSFSPIAAEAASRCLSRRPGVATTTVTTTAVIIASTRGDLASAAHVAHAVDTGAPLGPLLFFQSVPNAVAGHIAARWNLTGPVVCVADRPSALEAAALLIEDGDADEALVLHVEQSAAHAVLLRVTPFHQPGSRP